MPESIDPADAEDEAWEKAREDRRRLLKRQIERIRHIHQRNVETTPGQLGEILALHAPMWNEYYSERAFGGCYTECSGCEFGGHEANPPEWPCKTYRIASRHLRQTDG